MDLIRRNLFFIISGIVAAGGVGLAYTGITAMPEILDDMQQIESLSQQLDRIKSKPVNLSDINSEQKRIKTTQEDLARIKEKGSSLVTYEPLTPDAFPNGDDNARRNFQKAYGVAMQELFDELQSGQPATVEDAKIWQLKVENEKFQAQEKGLDAGSETDAVAKQGPAKTASGVLTRSGAKVDAKARAAMAIAQKSYCYAVPIGISGKSKVPSLDFHRGLVDTGTVDALFEEAVWFGQIGYWIQNDVVKAIVAVNQEAATQARKRGEDGWIGNMPVKEVISIRVSDGYVLPEAGEFAGAAPSGYEDAMPPRTGDTVFTRSVSSANYEVIQFTIKLVMDQRDIPRMISQLTSNNFYTVLRTAYQVAPPSISMDGKIYGPEPNVIVVFDVEAVMLGDVFRPMMPPIVCEILTDNGTGIVCPEPADGDEETE